MAIERIESGEFDRYDEIEGVAAARPRGGPKRVDGRPGDANVEDLRDEAVALMRRAAAVIEDDPACAARFVDRAARVLARLWEVRQDRDRAWDDAPDSIERADPLVARQLALARRAKDERDRLRHCRAALVLIERVDPGLEPADVGCAQFGSRRSGADAARAGQSDLENKQ